MSFILSLCVYFFYYMFESILCVWCAEVVYYGYLPIYIDYIIFSFSSTHQVNYTASLLHVYTQLACADVAVDVWSLK